MNRRRLNSALIFAVLSLSMSTGFSRTDKIPDVDDRFAALPLPPSNPVLNSRGARSPYFISWQRFLRLRSRLSIQSQTPLPGHESLKIKRYRERYFTENDRYELLPILDALR